MVCFAQRKSKIAILFCLLLFCSLLSQCARKYTHGDMNHAIFNNKHALIKKIIKSGYRHPLGKNYNFLLRTAIAKNNYKMIEYFVKAGADLNAGERSLYAPLHYALFSKDCSIKLLDLLLRHGAKINLYRGVFGWTPLHIAVVEQPVEIVKYLLSKGAKVELAQNRSIPTLLLAIRHEAKDVALLLINRGVDVNRKSRSRKGMAPLHEAAKIGDLQIIRALLRRGANIEVKDRGSSTPLHYAVLNGSLSVVRLLLENGANPNNAMYPYGRTLNNESAGQPALKKLLLEYELIDWEGDTLLHKVLIAGNLKKARSLIGRFKLLNKKNKNGDTPLHIALQRGYPQIAKLLLRKGVKFNIKNNKGQTPLFFAVKRGYTEIVKLLNKKH